MDSTNKKFKLTLNGKDIEALLRSVGSKMNADAITTDVKSTSDKEVLSARVTNELLTTLLERTAGNGVKQMLEKAPDVHALTDALLAKINALKLVFIGSMGSTERDSLDTSGFKGGEVLLLLNSADTRGLLQYWDRNTSKWITASILEGHRNATTSVSSGVSVIQTFNKLDYRTATFTVSVRTSDEIHVDHFTMGWDSTNTYISSYGSVQNGDALFTLSTDVNGGNVEVRATTTKNNSRIQIEVQSLY